MDLSQLAPLEGALRGAGLDPATPTLILAEVVLPYMQVERFVLWSLRPSGKARASGAPGLHLRRQVLC